jgi:hypothetical protein
VLYFHIAFFGIFGILFTKNERKYSMTTLKKVFLLLTLPALVFACASSTGVKKPPAFRITETTLAQGLEDRGTRALPVNITHTFTTHDSEVVSFLTYQNLSGTHTLRWEWYDPEGRLYTATENYPLHSSPGYYIKEGSACHRISVKGAKAESLPGDWHVKIYLDNDLTAHTPFKIIDIRVAEKSPLTVPQDITFGTYHALVIGNNEYRFLPKLQTAINDAAEVGDVLKHSYGFEVTVLTDASRADILLALESLREQLTAQDNLLIYYAGHGWLDEDADEGYWLPVDAQRDNSVNWVSNSSVTSTLKAIAAKHVLVVADSCYSGKLARGLHIVKRTPDYLVRISQKRVRTVLCSGGLEPVIDTGGKGGHSVFAAQFIDALKENRDVILGSELFTKIRRPVMLSADQSPEYADIRKAGHEGGDFLFIRRY